MESVSVLEVVASISSNVAKAESASNVSSKFEMMQARLEVGKDYKARGWIEAAGYRPATQPTSSRRYDGQGLRKTWRGV